MHNRSNRGGRGSAAELNNNNYQQSHQTNQNPLRSNLNRKIEVPNNNNKMPKKVCKSWSRSPSEVVEISHIWTIENFSLRNDKKVIYSSTFWSPQNSGDRKKEWRLELSPNGNNEENKDYISLFLTLLAPEETAVEVSDSFSMQDEKGNILKTSRKSNVSFTRSSSSWGFSKFCKRNEILGKMTNDVLKVKCELSYLDVVHENLSGTDTEKDALKCDLSDNLGALLTSGDDEFSDVTISVGSTEDKTEFKAHRNILAARSPYFAAMFRNEMREKRENRVEIRDVKPEVFRNIITYVYTGNAPKNMNETVAKEILISADRFALEKLKTLAENFLVSKLTVENALDLLILSDTHSAETLKNGATEYVAANLKEILKTDGWKNLILRHPHLANEHGLMGNSATEEENSEDEIDESIQNVISGTRTMKRKKAETSKRPNVRRSKRRN